MQKLTLSYKQYKIRQCFTNLEEVVRRYKAVLTKIEQLKEEITRHRNDYNTQLTIITALQQQLRTVEIARRDLQELVLALRQEIQTYQTQIQIFKDNDELSTLQAAFRILKKRYTNCQEENSILRAEILEKEDEIQKISGNNRQLTDKNDKLKLQLQALAGQLTIAGNGLEDLRKLNSELQHSRSEWELRYRQLLPVLEDYESRFGLVDRELRESQRAEEGWFCEFKDLRETVEHIQELRQNVRLKKIAKLHPA